MRVGSGRRRGRNLECEVFWREVPVHLETGKQSIRQTEIEGDSLTGVGREHVSVRARVRVHVARG